MSRIGEIMKMRAIRKLFDREFYLRTNPDVAAAAVDPLRHYVKHGATEGRQPHPLFDPEHYLACCPEARVAENPLLHFVRKRAGKWPGTHPLFDCQAYADAHPEAANPLLHYITWEAHEGTEGSQFGQC
jgi:hypothetical protein